MDVESDKVPASNLISELPIFTVCQFLDIWSAKSWALTCRSHQLCLTRRLASIAAALQLYSDKPAETIARLVSLQAIQPTALGITRFLYESGERLAGEGTAQYLTEPGDRDWESKRARSVKLISEYISLFDFSSDTPVQALRRVLRYTRLPPSTTATGVFLRKVACRYWECKRGLAEREGERSARRETGSPVPSPLPSPSSPTLLTYKDSMVMTTVLPHFLHAGGGAGGGQQVLSTQSIEFNYSLNPGYARRLESTAGSHSGRSIGTVTGAGAGTGTGAGAREDGWRPLRASGGLRPHNSRSAGLSLAVQALAPSASVSAAQAAGDSLLTEHEQGDSDDDEEEEAEDGAGSDDSEEEEQAGQAGSTSSFVDVSLHTGPWPEGLAPTATAEATRHGTNAGVEAHGEREEEQEDASSADAGEQDGDDVPVTSSISDFTGNGASSPSPLPPQAPPLPLPLPHHVHGLDLTTLLDPTSLYVLLYALIILNTDMRSPSIPLHRKLGAEAWVAKTRQVSELACLPPAFLHAEYADLAQEGLQVSAGSPTGPVYHGPGTYAALAMAQGRGALGALLEGGSTVFHGLQGSLQGTLSALSGQASTVLSTAMSSDHSSAFPSFTSGGQGQEQVTTPVHGRGQGQGQGQAVGQMADGGGEEDADGRGSLLPALPLPQVAADVRDRVTSAAAGVAHSMGRALSVLGSMGAPSAPPAQGQGVRVSDLFASLSMREQSGR